MNNLKGTAMHKFLCLIFFFGIVLCAIHSSPAQVERRDRALFVEPKNEFMDSVRKAADQFINTEESKKKSMRMDFTGISHPAMPEEFTQYWHNKPVSQAISGMCWCFSTTSFYESEIYRLTKREIKLSELYTVYWEYVEKTRRFIQERGNSVFGEGSEANAVSRIWKTYGIVPADAYSGKKPGQIFHDHRKLFTEMNDYLNSVKTTNTWNEETAVATIKSILNHYIGEPPKTVSVAGKTMTPQEYFAKIVRLNLDDYIECISLREKPYYQMAEYEVSDNWWHSKEYYNIPLDEFMAGLRKSVRSGYTVCLGGDVSEPGIDGHEGVAMVPSFDIPSAYIDENARQYRFNNGTTGDDHGIHLVGYLEKDGKDWYLIKDSGSGSRNNKHPGYYFYQEDYVKLKMLGYLVHKNAIKDLIKITKQ
jgi:bleomycin hydrolase